MGEKIELLAPAGGEQQLIAAVENGADAVYTGGRFLNARESAGNFDDETMEKAVNYAKLNGVKFYVAMNTLVSDAELEEGYQYAKFLYETGVDALIIQDLGLGRYIRKRLPDMELHLSTQCSAYGRAAMKLAKKMGYSRVVPARELTKEEIQGLCKGEDPAMPEIEVFCHGALCVCYSGQCQLSRYNGGRSGNRGSCAQPCRLMYRTLSSEGAVLTEGVSDYPLSPKDLCLIDDLGDLIDAGVSSLKIEGRLKSPEYVAVVTSIYRKYIDEYYRDGSYSVSPEDREALEQIFSRGHSRAYYAGVKDDAMMVDDIPKHRGVKIGRVIRRIDGQLIEVHAGELTGGIVTYLRRSGAKSGNVKTAFPGVIVEIGDIKGAVREGDDVYRTSSTAQLKKARRSFEKVDLGEGVGRKRIPVDLSMAISDKSVLVHAETEDGVSCECWRELPETLGTPNGSPDRFIKALKKTGGTPFETGKIEIPEEVQNLDMKVSMINEMRRQVLIQLKNKIRDSYQRKAPETAGGAEDGVAAGAQDRTAEPSRDDGFWNGAGTEQGRKTVEVYFDDWASFHSLKVPESVKEMLKEENVSMMALLPLVDVIRHAERLRTVKFMPYISNISKGREDAFLKLNADSVKAVVEQTGVYVGNLEWLAPLIASGIRVKADFGLNIYNSEAEKAFSDLGVSGFARSLEKEGRMSGRYPLMTLEHKPEGAVLSDPLGRNYYLKRRDFSDQVILKPASKTEAEFEVMMANAIRTLKKSGDRSAVRVYL